jgi:hypothetical protein
VHLIPTKPLVAGAAALALSVQPTTHAETLKIYMMIGQSNMEGQAYAWEIPQTGPGTWNVPTMQYLNENPAYLDALPNSTFTFKTDFDGSYFTPRNDVWAVNYDSANGNNLSVRNTADTDFNNTNGGFPSGVQPLSPGFGPTPNFGGVEASRIGAELAMGHRLGDALDAPVLLFKSSKGGKDLAYDFRPPSAVADRGGSVGPNYTNSVNRFKQTLDTLDADLADDGKLNDYNNATGYEVAGVVWLQGWNTVSGSQAHYTTAQKIAEYDDNLEDLIEDIRASDPRISDTLPMIVVESSDQNAQLNAQRQAGVDAINADNPGSAVFIETNGLIGVNYGGKNSAGGDFSNGYGYHFHARPENFLQMGWDIGGTVLDNGYTTGLVVPEPASALLLGLSALATCRRRR